MAVGRMPTCERCGAPALVNIHLEQSAGPTYRHLCLACAEIEELAGAHRHRRLNYSTILVCLGTLVLIASLFADWIDVGDADFAMKQEVGILAAGVLVVMAALLRIPVLLVIGLFVGAVALLAGVLARGHQEGFGWFQTLGAMLGLILIAAAVLESKRQK